MSEPCPCGSGVPEPACCARWFRGTPAPTALALMRSRYTAFVRGEIDYLIATHAPETRGDLDRASLARYAKTTTWLGLEIVAVEGGGETDDAGVVEFVARGSQGGRPFAQRERSRFRRLDGVWLYLDGALDDRGPGGQSVAGANPTR